jgi:phenylalanyl-tRNA synthetase beta chain
MDACPRYSGVTLSGICVMPSPAWLQERLTSIGLRPINNVVDATNFVLHEIGQPLHAFDADKIAGKTIHLRTCADGTPFVTLDGVERKLSQHDLMICDNARPMCIAGVFGGMDSGISEGATQIFLESAYFNPVWVRRTARRHGLSTDASFRYERGADPNITVYALKRAAMLIKEIAGGRISSDIVDVYPKPVDKQTITLSYDYLNALAGKDIPPDVCKKILHSLEYEVA